MQVGKEESLLYKSQCLVMMRGGRRKRWRKEVVEGVEEWDGGGRWTRW